MSRTYRKTKKKQGARGNWRTNWTQYQLDMKDVPPPHRENARYKRVTEEVTIPGHREAPKDPKDPRWCTKGQPGAIPEYITEYKETISLVNGVLSLVSWPQKKESGRYYLAQPETKVMKTRRKRIYVPIEIIDWDAERKIWDHHAIFNHIRKNGGTRRRKRRTAAYYKRRNIRNMRLKGKEQLRKWEDEYHLNQHLEPYNWVLDDEIENDPWYEEMDWWYEPFEDYEYPKDEPEDDLDYLHDDAWDDYYYPDDMY